MIPKKRIFQIVCDVGVILAIGIIFLLVNSYVQPFERGFYCNDNDIFYPLLPDIIPAYAVGLFGILGTIVAIILIEIFNIHKNFNTKQLLISIYHGLTIFLLGLIVTLLLTEIGKRWIGRLRPHFIEVCKPDLQNLKCSFSDNVELLRYIETNGTFCKGNSKDIKEARLSFPSGHSSISFYTMIFLITYIEARVNGLTFRFFKVLLQLTALIAAYVTSISRIKDNHHRGTDVLGGAIIGIIVAIHVIFVSGRVIWLYNRTKPQYDFDLNQEEILNRDTLNL
jgi:phosphatidate phosphatase